ncbi:hypothetical protein HZS_2786, partial [Henneguya salminicola]
MRAARALKMSESAGIGSKFRVITKRQVRYVGILSDVNEIEATLTLKQAKCYGTEDRKTENAVAARNKIYEFIEFNGSDLIDISPILNTNDEEFDPAIRNYQESDINNPNNENIKDINPHETNNPK